MPTVEFICLANSYKHQARCIAGMSTDTGVWIRPLGARDDGALSPNESACTNGAQPEVYDVLRVQVDAYCPQPHQPENWRCSGGAACRWKWVRKATDDERRSLRTRAMRDGLLFGTRGDRIPHRDLLAKPATASLALVSAKRLRWRVARKMAGGPLKCRATFTLGEQAYDLAVTDPAWRAKMLEAGEGEHRSEDLEAGRKGGKVLLVVSLSEPAPFDDCCYKLVAGVLLVPDDARMDVGPPRAPSRAPKGASFNVIRVNHPKAYVRWTAEDDQLLSRMHEQGEPIAEMGRALGRKLGGITSRLRKLGCIQ